MNQELVDYEKITEISNRLKKISNNIENILNEVNERMQCINTEDYYKSRASKKMLDKFNDTSKNFYKFYKEIEENSLYLDRKIIDYTISIGISKDYIEDTTTSYLERLERNG